MFAVGRSMKAVTLSISNMQVVVRLTMMKGVIEYRCYYTVSCVVKTSLNLCSVAVACVIRVLWSSVASCENSWLYYFRYMANRVYLHSTLKSVVQNARE